MEDVVSLYDEAEEHFNDKVEVWCNNAGINHNAGWRKCMDIDIMAVMMGTYYAMDRMSKTKGGRGGLIVNTASVAGLVFNQIQDREISDANSYFVAKHGVITHSFDSDAKNGQIHHRWWLSPGCWPTQRFWRRL